MRSLNWGYLNSLLALGLALLVGKWLLRSLGIAIGWYLKRKTSARRRSILLQVQLEEESFQTQERYAARSDDEDWERVESYKAGTASNGGRAYKDWEGVIGFFHPFW